MQPSLPPSSRSNSRREAHDRDDATSKQAGRSSTNLAAQESAQTLREASRPSSRAPSRSSSSPSLLRQKTRQQPTAATDNATIPEVPPPLTSQMHSSIRQPSPQTPSPSSLSNPTPSTSSSSNLESRKNSDEIESASSTSAVSHNVNRAATGATIQVGVSGTATTNARGPSQEPPKYTRQRDSSASLARVSTPRSVRDLGSDYTRYFSPFASQNTSQNDSQPDFNTPLPRFNSSTHLMIPAALSSTDLSKRLSNPFEDKKRLSNPFESAQTTAPGTPLPRDTSLPTQGNETKDSKTSKIAAAAVVVPGKPGYSSAADPEKNGFYSYVDDRLGAPDPGFPLFSDEKEDDDDMHMPAWDDDIRLKPKLKDHFTRGNISSTLGMIFMMIGLLLVFVALPVVSFTGTSLIDYAYDTPLDQMGGAWTPAASWSYVNDEVYPMMTNIKMTLLDPDTPAAAKTRTGINGENYTLVFSDEFNELNRTFYPGDDAYFFAPDIWYGATLDLEWYDPDAVNTGDGTLQLQMDQFPNHGLDYRSGMLNSWNQLCFQGGIFEISASLPGPAGVHGLWPGAWTMGNLGRPGYLSTTDGMWPYTYNDCDAGITPNQSMTDGTSNLPGQRLPSCTCSGEDHPTPGTGRGAPEIDIIEVSADWGGLGLSVATQSFQVAPFDIWYYPNYDFMETPDYNISFVNTYTGGPYQQAVSTTSMLNNDWYDGKEYQKYAFEYTPGSGADSGITWYVGDDETMRFDGRAVGPNGNVGQRLVAEEPMTIILNLGMSLNWGTIEYAELFFPTVYRIDYIRWYQKEGETMVTCDPPGYETTEYIANHAEPYNNPNLTLWNETEYRWPTNTLMDGCAL